MANETELVKAVDNFILALCKPSDSAGNPVTLKPREMERFANAVSQLVFARHDLVRSFASAPPPDSATE